MTNNRIAADYACDANPNCGWRSTDTSRPLSRGMKVGCPNCKGDARFIGMDHVPANNRIEEIRARERAASSGPWVVTDGQHIDQYDHHPDGNRLLSEGSYDANYHMFSTEDVQFIAHARQDIPYLLSLLDARPVVAAEDDWVAWLRYDYTNEETIGTTISVCDSDAKGAFKVYRAPVKQTVPAVASRLVNVNAHGELTRARLREIQASVSNGYEVEYRKSGWSKALQFALRDLHFLLTFFRDDGNESACAYDDPQSTFKPPVAADARELVDEWFSEACSAGILDDLAQRITAYANQRGEQRWREGVEKAAQKAEQQWALMSSFSSTETDHYTRACHEAAAAIRALLNRPADKADG